MARIAYTEVQALPDAADQVPFELLLGTLPGVSNSRQITVSCLNVQIAGSSSESYAVTLHGHTRNFRGRRMNSGSLAATFVEVSGHNIRKQLTSWLEFCAGYESGNSQGYIADYSVLATLVSYDTTGAVASRMQYEELFIQDIADLQHDGATSAALNLSATFKFSRAYPLEVPLT